MRRNSTADYVERLRRNRSFEPRMTRITRMGKSTTENDRPTTGRSWLALPKLCFGTHLPAKLCFAAGTRNRVWERGSNDVQSKRKKSSQTCAIFHDGIAEDTDEERKILPFDLLTFFSIRVIRVIRG